MSAVIVLPATGDPTSSRGWSGHPCYFLQAGLRAGLFVGGVVPRRESHRLLSVRPGAGR